MKRCLARFESMLILIGMTAAQTRLITCAKLWAVLVLGFTIFTLVCR